MTAPRFTSITPESFTPEQKRIADAIQSGPRKAPLSGPFTVLLHSPTLCDLAQQMGAHIRFKSAIPPRVNEIAILMVGRKWNSQFEFHAHTIFGLEAGLSQDLIDSLAQGKKPANMKPDEEAVYDFAADMLDDGFVSDTNFNRVKALFGETGAADLVGALGFYCLISMTLNAGQVGVPEGIKPPLKAL